tara:strand:- start:213 stop:461 length:249 start_codon:yes stop_codon:yes gene_type:complete
MNITLLETNKKKLKAISNKLKLIAGNINTEIRILLDRKKEMDKLCLSVNGDTLMIEEIQKLTDQIKFLKSQESNLYDTIKTI